MRSRDACKLTYWTHLTLGFKDKNQTFIELLYLQLIQAGKGEALRIRAILRSLVPIEDLVGVISLPLQIPCFGKGEH